MGLLDELRAAVETDRRCKFARIRESLTPEEREAIDACVASGVSFPKVRAILRANGNDVDHDGIRAHYAQDCPCR